jgi:GNAT superfamily N-acetyltransferase
VTALAIRIVPATIVDAPLIYELTRIAFGEFLGVLDPPSGAFAESVADVAEQIRTGGAGLALYNGAPAGAVRFRPEPGYLYAGRLAVLPEFRRLGVAAALMRFVEAQAVDWGKREVRVGVRSALPGNLEFFERIGFRQVSVEPHPRNPSATSVTMAKRIAQARLESIDVN